MGPPSASGRWQANLLVWLHHFGGDSGDGSAPARSLDTVSRLSALVSLVGRWKAE
jgi:hypothetical protein